MNDNGYPNLRTDRDPIPYQENLPKPLTRKQKAEAQQKERQEAYRDVADYAEQVKAEFRQQRGKQPKAPAKDFKKPFMPTNE